MTSWSDVEAAAPELAAEVRRLFDARKHKTMATLRKNGSPRISGMEVEFRDGDALLGMMGDSCKAKDVLRDPRLAVHSPTVDPTGPKEPGDVVTITIKYANTGSKAVSDIVVSDSLSGRLEYVTGSAQSDRPANFSAFERLYITRPFHVSALY